MRKEKDQWRTKGQSKKCQQRLITQGKGAAAFQPVQQPLRLHRQLSHGLCSTSGRHASLVPGPRAKAVLMLNTDKMLTKCISY